MSRSDAPLAGSLTSRLGISNRHVPGRHPAGRISRTDMEGLCNASELEPARVSVVFAQKLRTRASAATCDRGFRRKFGRACSTFVEPAVQRLLAIRYSAPHSQAR